MVNKKKKRRMRAREKRRRKETAPAARSSESDTPRTVNDVDSEETAIVMGVAWYRPEQWSRLREVSADRDDLEDKFEQWLQTAEESFQVFVKKGIKAIQVDVDVEELIRWCRNQKLDIDSKARARYAMEVVIPDDIKRTLGET